jgi:hypothetical protein
MSRALVRLWERVAALLRLRKEAFSPMWKVLPYKVFDESGSAT